MSDLSGRPNAPFDLAPLARLLTEEDDLALVNPSAKFPFDPLEWREKWLNEPDDESFYLIDEDGREVGFFALRVGIGPEVRHLVYVFIEEAARGGAGRQLTEMAEAAARARYILANARIREADVTGACEAGMMHRETAAPEEDAS